VIALDDAGAEASADAGVESSAVIPVVSPAQVPAGTYWIMAEYNGDPQICVDTATGNKIDYFTVGFGAVPQVFPTANSNAGQDLNYFVVGQP
jgi:hypothetical protein